MVKKQPKLSITSSKNSGFGVRRLVGAFNGATFPFSENLENIG